MWAIPSRCCCCSAKEYVADFPAGVAVWHWQVDHQVKTPRAQEGGIDHVQPIRRPQYDHSFQLLDAVHLGEKLADDTISHPRIATPRATYRAQGVDLVEEDDAGGR